MLATNLQLSPRAKSPFDIACNTTKMSIADVFSERTMSRHINEYHIYLAHYNQIPNFISEIDINCKKANLFFAERYQSEIHDSYYNKRYIDGPKRAVLDDIFYFLDEDFMVNFDTNMEVVRFMFRKTALSKVEEVIADIKKFKKRKRKDQPMISLLVSGRYGLETKVMQITRQKLNIEDNYNEDFKAIHKLILSRLSRKNDKGLVLLHGKPGIDKTSYIRYLIVSLKKDVIFLPPTMAGGITNPNLISILIENPNSVFVIKDPENIVMDRDQDGNSPVSALSNISDGLLADCLNVQIICSFNTDISKIDSALMRKGRLIAKYEFKDLEVQKAQHLSDKLGYKSVIKKAMPLTAIYNQEEKDF